MSTIAVDIVSAEGEIFSGEASMVFAPAQMGEVGIAPRHAPLLTGLKPGGVRVQSPEGDEREGWAMLGASNSFSVTMDDYQVTAVGEVPGVTVQRIASSMRRR